MKLPRKNKYPRKILIRDTWYTIRFVKLIDKDKYCLGLCDWDTCEILIKKGQSKKETLRTFIHECYHAMEAEWNIDIKHKSVYKLERATFRLLLDNF